MRPDLMNIMIQEWVAEGVEVYNNIVLLQDGGD
jgi:hypothetical protein